MTYQRGDEVYPTDLVRRFLCRVTRAESVRFKTTVAQVLRLVPLEGPWPRGTFLIRLEDGVRHAWRTGIAATPRREPRAVEPLGGSPWETRQQRGV